MPLKPNLLNLLAAAMGLVCYAVIFLALTEDYVSTGFGRRSPVYFVNLGDNPGEYWLSLAYWFGFGTALLYAAYDNARSEYEAEYDSLANRVKRRIARLRKERLRQPRD